MKNLPARERVRQRVPGPYGRKAKAPYIYSAAYEAWKRMAMRGGVPMMLRAYTVRGTEYRWGAADPRVVE
jgi:hypothetical protein